MTQAVQWPKLERQLVAILRGVRPEEAAEIVAALVHAGFAMIEIPLNSPEPFESIEIASALAGESCLIGAGTVLDIEGLEKVHEAGGRLMVSPNVNPAVLRRAHELGMVSMPGVFSPGEALLAVQAGSSALKFFPASVLGPTGISAICAVLPPQTIVGAVGGIDAKSFGAYAACGIRCFGLGGSLYSPGLDAKEVAHRAQTIVEAYDSVFARL